MKYSRLGRLLISLNITSRLGVSSKALVVSSLAEVSQDFDVVGIDEVHMFSPEDSAYIFAWVAAGKSVFVTALDVDLSR